MIVVRPHRISPKSTLDLRRLRESFLWMGRQLVQIGGHQIALLQLDRTNWKGNSFEDYWYRKQVSVNFRTPNQGSWAPGSDVDMEHHDGYVEGTLSWSILCEAEDVDCVGIWGVPFFQGQALWEGEDFSFGGTQHTYSGLNDASIPDPITSRVTSSPWTAGQCVTLGSTTAIQASGGTGMTGVLLVGLGSTWKISKSSIVVRFLNR